MFTVEPHTAPMTGAAWFIVTEDNNGAKVEGTDYYDEHADAEAEAARRNRLARPFIDLMPDPNELQESLYRVLHEELTDWFESMPGEDQGEIAASFAADLRQTANLIDTKVKEYEKE